MAFDAREWLEDVRGAARSLKFEKDILERRRERFSTVGGQGYGEQVSSSPNPDKMGPLDDVIDAELLAEGISEDKLIVQEAQRTFDGMRRVGHYEKVASWAFRLIYVNLMSQEEAAEALGMSRSTLRNRMEYGIDWLNAHGLAHAKEGKAGPLV